MIAIDYPANSLGEPLRLSAIAIADLASALRQQVAGNASRPVTLEAVISRSRRTTVNGRQLQIAWDIEHEVVDDHGKPVFGACVHDPAAPGTIMIYLNGHLLADRTEVQRSTAVHELAHAIFDMPAAFARPIYRAFRTGGDRAQASPATGIDWAEWRADEFMGAFLVPPNRLAKAVAATAPALNLRFGWRHDAQGRPAPFIDAAPGAEPLGWLVEQLAETFGVTPAFMATRLRRGGFIGRPKTTEDAR